MTPQECLLVCFKCGARNRPTKGTIDNIPFEGARCCNPKCRSLWMTKAQQQAYEEAKVAACSPGTSESSSPSPSSSEDGQS